MNNSPGLNENLNSIEDTRSEALKELHVNGIGVEIDDHGLKECFGESIENPYSITDLTYLKPYGGFDQIEKLCENAKNKKAKMVCVSSAQIKSVKSILSGSNIGVVTVENFPFGASDKNLLSLAIKKSFEIGADEVDFVFPHYLMPSKNYIEALNYLETVRKASGGVLKLILETSEYTSKEIAIMSLLARKAGINFVKTSTGFSKSGAKIFDISLMRCCVGSAMGVKASGGIKTFEEAIKMVEAGANRIGASELSIFTRNDSIY